MKKVFKAQLKKIVDHLSPDFRTQGQQDIDSLLKAGVRTYGDLLFVLLDKDKKVKIRTTAAWALARLNDKQAFPALLAALEDVNPELRAAAARSLGELSGKTDKIAVDSLITKLLDDDVRVRIAAAYGLGLLGAKSAVVPLVKILVDKSSDPKLRGVAAEALADLRDNDAVAPLISVLTDASEEVRYWASFALGELGAVEALPELKRLAATDDATLPGSGTLKEEAAAAIQAIREKKGED